tara:strand:+ start:10699 stop:12306 length:1608 start_codon:yes stop_codon:yes gene_type:complete
MKLSPLLVGEREPIALRSLSNLFYRRSKASINANFVRSANQTTFTKELPLELLPYLRPGRIYADGHITNQVEGSVVTVRLENLSQCNLVPASELPANIANYLGEGFNQFKGIFHRYHLANGLTLFVPSHELIRSLFAPSNFYINRILSASGLSYLYEYFEPSIVRQRKIHFTKQIPVSLLNNSFVVHFSWMVSDLEALKSWSQIYTNTLSLPAAERCLWCHPPSYEDVTLKVGCQRFGNDLLAQEIYGYVGLRLPFEYLSFTHPKLKERNASKPGDRDGESDEKKLRSQLDIGIEDYAYSAKFDSAPKRYRIPRTTLGFDSSVIVAEKTPSEETPTKTQSSKPSSDTEGEEVNEINHQAVSLMASQSGGDTKPLILDGLNACDGEYDGDLEDIEKAILRVSQLAPSCNISSGIFELPECGKKKFSKLGSGISRSAYIATIESSKGTTMLLEVDRSINHHISTVLIRLDSKKSSNLEAKVNEVLKLIVENSGSWPKDKLAKVAKDFGQVEFMQHRMPADVANPADYWAKRLIKKLQ